MFFSAFAFAAGMVALINPCGFALLPAYLGFFLGQEDDAPNRLVSLNRAQGVGLALSLGILVVFGIVGIVLTGFQSVLFEALPYFNIVLGIGLVGLGIAMLRGFVPTLKIPKMQKGGNSGSFGSMFLFGMSYATASLTCTIGVFSAAVGASSTLGSGVGGVEAFFQRFGAFVSYGLGMGLLATVLTLALALGKRGVIGKFRQVLPLINRFSAVILLLVGPWMILYGVWEIQIFNDPASVTPWLNDLQIRGQEVQSSINNLFSGQVSLFGRSISRVALLGWPFLILNVALAAAGLAARAMSRNNNDAATDAGAEAGLEAAEA